jgi:NADPH2:quinone reductase
VAATIGVAYGTALHALKDMAQLQENETVLVLGASGGTGSAAIEIARAMGATVIAAASTDAKLDHCRRIGAEHTINYDTEDLRASIEQIAPDGVGVVFDPVGDRYAEPALRSLGFRGRYLVVGFAAGDIPRLPLNLALLKERSIIGVYNGIWAKMRTQEVLTNTNLLLAWIQSQKLAPVITNRYSLDQAVDALQEAASRRVMGKIIIEVNTNLK